MGERVERGRGWNTWGRDTEVLINIEGAVRAAPVMLLRDDVIFVEEVAKGCFNY